MDLKKILVVLLPLFLLAAASTSAFGQHSSRKKKDTKKEEYSFKSHLWYGANFGLNFGGGYGASLFSLELSPMVGYKIWGPISAGPRLGFQYNNFKQTGYKAISLVGFEPGIFARCKIYGPIFAHVEGSNEFSQYIDEFGQKGEGTNQYLHQYFGLGYNTGDGEFGSELLLLYDIVAANDPFYQYSPFNFRFGLTWKF